MFSKSKWVICDSHTKQRWLCKRKKTVLVSRGIFLYDPTPVKIKVEVMETRYGAQKVFTVGLKYLKIKVEGLNAKYGAQKCL